MSLNFLLQIASAEPLAAASKTGVVEKSLWQIVEDSNGSGGWIINLMLTLMLGYTIFVFVERFLAVQKASKEDNNFLSKVKEYILDGKIDQAKDYCNSSSSPSARMVEKGISRLGKPLDNIAASIENTGKLEIMRLEQRLSFLATASGAGPMLGFLGTVLGMVGVFIALGDATSLSVKIIAPGIMTAMITTVFGLIVGIISFMGYNYLVGRIGKLVYKMEITALEFMDLLNEPKK
jgi:biopolymer transport protein ExbB